MTARCLIVGTLLLLTIAHRVGGQGTPSLPNQIERGLGPIPGSEEVKRGHHYIVAIGIDHYENWPVLSTAVSDATGLASLLTSQFGFEYVVDPLPEKEATRGNIESLIDDDLRHRIQPEDDLIIFFAGHGTTRDDKVGDATESVGFLVPVNARGPGTNEHWSDYIKIDDLLHEISTLPSRHILVILDSCHSGMALGSKFHGHRADSRFRQEMLRNLSREVITSARGDQLAADAGAGSGHSLFTGLMIQGLTTGKADVFQQGFITGTQLGAFVQHEVSVQEGSRQTPQFGGFSDLDAGGELIIPLGAGKTVSDQQIINTRPTAAMTQLESLEVVRVRGDSFYWASLAPTKNFPAARSGLVKLCDGGDGWACGQAAYSFFMGRGGSKDYGRAVELARQGCQQNISACVVLGALNEEGESIPPDLQSAKHLYEQTCDADQMYGCVLLGGLYQAGRLVKRDYTKAIQLYRKACDGGDLSGCRNVGTMFALGLGVPKDLVQAESFCRKACDGGEMNGCAALGVIYMTIPGTEKNYMHAASLYREACDAGHPTACFNLSQLYRYDDFGVKKDVVEAASLTRQACDDGEMHGCAFLGAMYEIGLGVEKDSLEAVQLFRRACDSGTASGCVNLGQVYEKGRGVEKDLVQALDVYRKACDLEDAMGCKILAIHYLLGDGVPKDVSKAATLTKKACVVGDQKACDDVKTKNMSTAERIRAIIIDQFAADAARVTPDANLRKDFGQDDWDIEELVERFEAAFDLEIPDGDARKLETVKDATNYIEKQIAITGKS